MQLALVGNCSYQALIDDRAKVVWLCWPRFDSSFVFGSLVDGERGGELAVTPADASSVESRQEYVRNTNLLRTELRFGDSALEILDFAPRFLQYERSFKPNMLVRRIRRLQGRPRIRIRCEPTSDYARLRPASYLASNHIQWQVVGGPLRLTTNLPLTYIAEQRAFLLDTDAYLVLTWGTPLEAPLAETCEAFRARTQSYWERWVKHTSLPGIFQEEIVRSALALKLHQFEDTGAITAASTTSLPEHDRAGRNWDYRYCWLRDAYFTLAAMRRLGHFEELERFVSFLENLVAASDGRLQPVYGISGQSDLHEVVLEHLAGYRGNRPVRAGNAAFAQVQNDVYGEMLAAISPLFLDIRFGGRRSQESLQLVHGLLERIRATLEEPDAGIWEYRAKPAVHTFPLLMHWAGARVATHIGQRIGDPALSGAAFSLAARASQLVETQCWREELGFYAESVEPTNTNADASLLMMVNLGYLRPGNPRAERHVRYLIAELNENGYLLRRYKHHDGIGQAAGSTFTVCGFWAAEALARLGYPEEADEMCSRLLGHANHVGLLSEDVDPISGEQWGNFPQTYSHVGLINAAFAIGAASGTLDHLG